MDEKDSTRSIINYWLKRNLTVLFFLLRILIHFKKNYNTQQFIFIINYIKIDFNLYFFKID
jgi:hypothetical protein